MIVISYKIENGAFNPENDFNFICWMGMLNGYIKVVDDINSFNMDIVRERPIILIQS